MEAPEARQVPVNNLYSSYEWLRRRVDRALRTELGNTARLDGVRQLCVRYSAALEEVSPLYPSRWHVAQRSEL